MIREYQSRDRTEAGRILDENGFSLWREDLGNYGVNTHRKILVSESESGRIAGVLIGEQVFETADLLVVCVAGERRKRGIGKALLGEWVKLLSKSKVDKVFLEVDTENLPALRLYEGLGFEAIETRKRYYQNGNDALVMRLSLEEGVHEGVRNRNLLR